MSTDDKDIKDQLNKVHWLVFFIFFLTMFNTMALVALCLTS
jgi:hypothetical protein